MRSFLVIVALVAVHGCHVDDEPRLRGWIELEGFAKEKQKLYGCQAEITVYERWSGPDKIEMMAISEGGGGGEVTSMGIFIRRNTCGGYGTNMEDEYNLGVSDTHIYLSGNAGNYELTQGTVTLSQEKRSDGSEHTTGEFAAVLTVDGETKNLHGSYSCIADVSCMVLPEDYTGNSILITNDDELEWETADITHPFCHMYLVDSGVTDVCGE